MTSTFSKDTVLKNKSIRRLLIWLPQRFTPNNLRIVACMVVVAILPACASVPDQDQNLVDEDIDRFEGFNRAMFSFNETIDGWVLKPIAKGYRWVTPDPVESGVTNFFNNLGEVRNILNDVLQWKWGQAGNDTGRFLLNTTFGVVGIFDVARSAGLNKSEGEDFGQTLAVWGVGQGPYLVLPFLGPSTLRDGAGLPVDWYSIPAVYVEPQRLQNTLYGLDLVQIRAGLLDLESLATGDRYLFLRDAYLQRREHLINDGEVEDEFGSDEFDDFD